VVWAHVIVRPFRVGAGRAGRVANEKPR